MSNPQIEDGYTRIANEILENVMISCFNGTQFRILLAIWRYTYGFQRTRYRLSINFLTNATKAHRRQVIRELNALIERKVIKVYEDTPGKPREIGFNKKHKEWIVPAPTIKRTLPEPKQEQPKKKKSSKPKYDESNPYYRMAKYFHNKVSSVAEREGIGHLVIRANMQSWADDMRKLIEIDKANGHLVKDVMNWVVTDNFWKNHVLSAKKLREKFAVLALRMKDEQKKKKGSNKPDPRDKELEFEKWVSEGNDPNEFDWS